MQSPDYTDAADSYEPDENILRGRAVSARETSTIFHYCSAETLITILTEKTLRFSDAKLLNDGEEVLWPQEVFYSALKRIVDRTTDDPIANVIPKSFCTRLEKEWRNISSMMRHFLCCFSDSGDSLSQWRAYADDGRGFSLGLSTTGSIPAQMLEVLYSHDDQIIEVIDTIKYIFAKQKLRSKTKYIEFSGDIIGILARSIAFKNPAFRDEREIRLSHLVYIENRDNNSRFKLLPIKEDNITRPHDGNISFRASGGRLVGYVDFELITPSNVKEVWIGPKCASSEEDLTLMLSTLGYTDVKVKVAGSRYR